MPDSAGAAALDFATWLFGTAWDHYTFRPIPYATRVFDYAISWPSHFQLRSWVSERQLWSERTGMDHGRIAWVRLLWNIPISEFCAENGGPACKNEPCAAAAP